MCIRDRYHTLVATCISVNSFAYPKLAVVALLQRLFPMGRFVRILFWFMAISLCFCCLLASILWYAQCTPRAHQWDLNVDGTCWNASVVANISYFVAAYSAFLDVVFALYPPLVIRQLKLPTNKKIGICLTLGGGLIAAASVCYKATTISGLSAQARKDPLCECARTNRDPRKETLH